MLEILGQLGINQTFFIQFGIFFVLFLVIPNLFFKPFQKLIEERHQKTHADHDKAAQLVAQANAKMEEYKNRWSEERNRIRAEMEKTLAATKAEETKILAGARAEAKNITQATVESITTQTTQLKRALEADIEGFALQISETLLKGRG